MLNSNSPGECLPSGGELAKRYGVSRHTLRRAVDELVDSGLVERRHGKGVYVLDTYLDYQIGKGNSTALPAGRSLIMEMLCRYL